MNTDPKNPVAVPSATVFTYGQKLMADVYTSTSVASAPWRVLAQSWTENTYVYEAQYNFAAYNAPDGWWNNFYGTTLANLENAKKQFPTDIADPAKARNAAIIADILEVYGFNILVTTYGNIPYKQAFNRSIPFPAYDDAKTVYTDLLTRLDTCIAGINTGAASLGAADQIYKGDMTKWKKFAATLKLKMAMLLADTDLTTATKKVTEAVTTGVFAANSDNALFVYQSDATTNTNPVWQALVNSGRHDFAPANTIVNVMNSWSDPRLPLYYKKDGSGNYSGAFPGKANSYGSYSDFSDAWQSQVLPADLLDYAETEFLLSEAVARGIAIGGTAESHYNAGITASILFWGGSATAATTYLLQPGVAYTTAAGDYKQKIGYQKWIALANRGWDAWTEIRRLKQPNLDVVNPPTGANGKLPLRFYYPLTTEKVSNSVNWSAAVKTQFGGTDDLVSYKLFWMP